ncbi:MAG: hypothetical protein H0W86_03260 [Armatimonadetes bacterium]|nr:hypothetical protein [Armatimonadota bacterium]
MTTAYYSVNGKLVGQKASGVRSDYLSDALGSVVAVTDQSAVVQSTFRYKPYGTVLHSTGAGTAPPFGWVGRYGYRATLRDISSTYVRARHYATPIGAWTTKDLVFRSGSRYVYADAMPTFAIDPSGLQSCTLGDWPRKVTSRRDACLVKTWPIRQGMSGSRGSSGNGLAGKCAFGKS